MPSNRLPGRGRMPPRPRGYRMTRVGCTVRVVALACALVFSGVPCAAADAAATAEPISFPRAVDLALLHSGVMGTATVNQWRARKAYEEVRANYIPQLTIGSGLGYSYGFPLTLEGSAPSVANFNSVILDTALTYAQLDQLTGKLKALGEAQSAADNAQFVTQQRLQQGVDSKLDLTKSQLVAARIRLRVAEAQGQADVLREHLSKLVGLPAESIAVEPESMPELPAISQ